MADLTEIQASQSVKIAGSNPITGIETNWMAVDANGTAQIGIYDAAANAITSQASGAQRPLDVILASPVKQTYMGTVIPFTPPATPTDMIVVTGSATRTIRILRIELSATQSTSANQNFYLIKRSTANTGGTTITVTPVAMDSTNSAVTATMVRYSANPTLGTAIGTLSIVPLYPNSSLAGNAQVMSPLYVWNFDVNAGQAPVLRGINEQLAINFNGAALPVGLLIGCTITWTGE